MFDKLSNIEQYIKLYGPWRCLTTYFRPRLKRHGLVEIHPFGCEHPIFLRPGTGDLSVFRQVFGDRQYGLRGFPQWNSVLTRAKEISAAGKRPVILDAGAKIDIEGAEHCLFASGTDWVSHVGVMIVELHDWMLPWEGSSSTFLSILADGQFDVVNRGENTLAFGKPVLCGMPARNA